MVQTTKRALKSNPFTTFRESDTGRWVIVHQTPQNNEPESVQDSSTSDRET